MLSGYGEFLALLECLFTLIHRICSSQKHDILSFEITISTM